MSDAVYRPLPPADNVKVIPPIETQMLEAPSSESAPDPFADVRLKRIQGEIIEVPEEGGNEFTRRRKEALGDAAEGNPKIYEWKADVLPIPGEHESPHAQVRRAAKNMGHTRRVAAAEELTQTGLFGPAQSEHIVDVFEKAPPTKVVPVGDAGNPVPPLIDNQPITEEISFKNLAEAKRGVQNFRDAQERERQELLAGLTQQAEAQRVEQERAAQPQPAPQPPQPQADALAQERARLAAQQHQLAEAAHWQRLSNEERQAAHEMAQIQQWASQSYTPGELQGQAPVQGDERAAWFAEAGRRYNELQAGLQRGAQYRAVAQTAAAQAHQQQFDAWGKQQDDIFERHLAQRHPQFTTDAGRVKMHRAAKEYLRKDLGLSQAQIDQEWRGGSLRAAGAQLMLADAIAHKMAQESARDLNSRKAIPSVQTPGVSRPRGAADMDRIRDLEHALASATGNSSLRLATQLHQARRDAGLV